MYSKHMTPSELLCAISELQDPKKSAKADISEVPEDEISIQDLLDTDLFDTDPNEGNQETKSVSENIPVKTPIEYVSLLTRLINYNELKLYKLDETDVRIMDYVPKWSRLWLEFQGPF
jgi:hypothetical protein